MNMVPHIDRRRRVALATPMSPTETWFQVRRSIEAIKSVWQKQADAQNTQLVTHIAKDIPEALPLDAHKIQYCLNNIVSNAIKFAQNGTVRIVVSKIVSRQDRPYLVLSVQDDGSGIEQEHLDTVFEAYPDNSKCESSTYGFIDTSLPTTHDLMNELGGRILVQSQIGKGTVFSLLLPCDALVLEANTQASSRSTVDFRQFSDYNILVVDDYSLNQVTVKAMLYDHVAKIFTASNGYEALEILHSCSVDIILMDIHMPVLDGIETTLKIRQSSQDWAGVRIVAMTADPQYQHMRLCRKIGMDDTLAKPFRKADILKVFENAAPPFKTVVGQ